MRHLRLPIMIADTSALRDLMDIEAAGNTLPATKNGGHFSVSKVIDALCVDGGRTLMMPGSVLTELFPTLTGRLTLATDEHGHAQFPIGFGQERFPRVDQHALYHYFSKLAQQGKLRCYNSPEEMFAAGEVGEKSNGGVVFVAMGEKRATDGHTYSKHKNHNAMVPLSPKKTAPAPQQPSIIERQPNIRPVVKYNTFKDQGDIDTCNLLWHIDDYAKHYNVHAKVLFFNMDRGIYQRAEDAGSSAAAEFVKPIPLIDTMVELGLLDSKNRPAFVHAMIELSTKDQIWRHLIDRMQTPLGKRDIELDSTRVKRWIETTQQSDTPTEKSR